MLARLKRILETPSTEIRTGGADAPAITVAALLFHAAALDGEVDAEEEKTIAALVRRRFDVSAEDIDAVMAEARDVEQGSSQILGFTRDIKDNSTHEERVALMEMLWEVVFADGEEHAFESNLMRRICGLIYVTDQESGAARRRVRERLGLA